LTKISSSVLSRATTAINSIDFRLHLWSPLHLQIIPHFTRYNDPTPAWIVTESGRNRSCN